MATNPYTSVNISGYNTNPPPDDGTTGADNQLKWSKHKDKIGDPLKNLAEGIDTNVLAAFSKTVNTDPDQNNAMAGSLAFTSSELTISSGSIEVKRSHHTVDTELDTASDVLDTIDNSSTSDGAIIYLRAENASRAVNIDSSGGNIVTFGSVTLSTTRSVIFQRVGTTWYRISQKDNEVDDIVALKKRLKASLSDDDVIKVKWYATPGDDGGGEFRWVSGSSATDNGGTIIATDEGGTGRWIRVIEGILTVKHFGLTGDGITDDTTKAQAMALSNPSKITWTKNTYILKKQISFPADIDIYFEPGTILDFSSASIAGDFGDLACVRLGEGSLTALPALNTAVAKGDIKANFASAPSLDEGDILVLFNPVAGSWLGSRVEYTAGEFQRVARVSGNDAIFYGRAFDAYATSISTFKMTGNIFNLTGSVEIKSPNITGIKNMEMKRGIDSSIDGLIVNGGVHSGLQLIQCYNVSGRRDSIRQERNSGTGLQYGIVIGNCQHIYFDGEFCGDRHGSTTGSSNIDGSIVNRDIIIGGVIKSSSQTSISAADWHGNAEYCKYYGLILGGVNIGGNNNKVEGTIYDNPIGVCINANELKGWSHDLSGTKMFAKNNAAVSSALGLINFGGDGGGPDANTIEGGYLNLKDIVIEAPAMTGRTLEIRNRGSVPTQGTLTITVDISGMKLRDSNAGLAQVVRCSAVTGDAIDMLIGEGFDADVNPGWNVTVNRLRGFRDADTVAVTSATDADNANQAVTFNKKFPKTPIVVLSPEGSSHGTAVVVVGATGKSTGGFTAEMRTADQVNFSVATAKNIDWFAVLDE